VPPSARVPMAPPPAGRTGGAPGRPGAGGRQGGGGQAARTTSTGRPLTQAELAMRQRVLEENRRNEAQRQREERDDGALCRRRSRAPRGRRSPRQGRSRPPCRAGSPHRSRGGTSPRAPAASRSTCCSAEPRPRRCAGAEANRAFRTAGQAYAEGACAIR
jgi:translation initiation factor IF-2